MAGTGPEPRNASNFWQLRGERKQILPSQPPKGTSPAGTLTLAQWE